MFEGRILKGSIYTVLLILGENNLIGQLLGLCVTSQTFLGAIRLFSVCERERVESEEFSEAYRM